MLKEYERYVTTYYMCFILELIHILIEIVVFKLYRIVELEMVQRDPRVPIDEVWTKYEDKFQDWFKNYVSLKVQLFTLCRNI